MKKALAVGINNYPFAPLRGCIRDATEFAELIATHGDESINFHVLLKTNVMRKEKLRELITDLFSGYTDTALLYFSGHGYLNESGAYLLTPDHMKYDEGIPMNDLLLLANNSPATNKVIILDCCHSGAITAPQLSQTITSHISEGVTLLTASRREETAMESNGQGIFTGLLLEALRGGAANINGHITPGSIYAYIDQALGPWEQRPVFKTNISRFTSLRNVAPAISNQVLKRITSYFASAGDSLTLDPSFEFTNAPDMEQLQRAPFADAAHVAIFKDLQQMHGAGLVEPIDEEHMYWAAMNSKSCRLTLLGQHYWNLVHNRKI